MTERIMTESILTESVLVRAHALSLRRGGDEIIRSADFGLGPGLWLMRGANGSGKSTLLRALAGVGAIATGRIEIAGHDLVRAPEAARRQLGYAPQSAELLGYLSVREFLQTVAALRGTSPADATTRAQRWIHARCLDRRIDTLSAGQRRKLCLCAALCGEPRVLLLDEPETGLDVDAGAELRATLQGLAELGHAVVIASHTEFFVGDECRPVGQIQVHDGHARVV